MGLYEDKLHEFLSQPENFEYAWEIYETMPALREKLKSDALNEFEKLATPLAQAKGWICWRLDPERVGIYKPNWNRLFAMKLYIGKQYYQSLGLWHDKDHASLKDRYDDLVERTKDAAKTCKIKSNGTESLWYSAIGTNFEFAAEMKELLPANRGALVRGYWDRLWEMAKVFEPAVDEIVRDLGGRV